MKESMTSPYNFIEETIKEFRLPEKIILYDSTLRDGEQMPGVSFSPEEKLILAKKLDEIGIPEIEAGFPAASKRELKIVKAIANEGLHAKILVLSRLKKEDIDAAITSDADVILLFIASSPLHLKYKLKLTEEEIKKMIEECIEYALDHGITPSFSTEDSTRTPIKTLETLSQVAIETGAKRIGFTDTVGCANPQAIYYLFSNMKNKLKSIPISAHLHNDFGLALYNAIVALHAGANHLCVTIGGVGERAGNVPLEQIVCTLKYLYNRDLGIKTEELYELVQMVSDFAGIKISKHHPLIGENAFAHESGIHVAAVLNNPFTYEPISPEVVGNKRKILFGKHTGHTLVDYKLKNLGLSLDEEKKSILLEKIKDLGEKKGLVTEEEFFDILNSLEDGE
jgi:methanogen homocitrate synthase